MSDVLTQLQEHFSAIKGSGPLLSFRKKGWEKFLEMGLPRKTQEAFSYLSLQEFSHLEFMVPVAPSAIPACVASAIIPECCHSYLVFIDGYFCKAWSDVSSLPSSLVVLSLEEALRTHSAFLHNSISRSLKEEQDPFALLNLALHPQGAFVYLPPQEILSAPLQCLFVYTSDWPQALFPRLHLILGKEAQASCVVQAMAKESLVSHFTAPLLEIGLEERAQLHLVSLGDALPHAWHFETIRATLKQEAQLRTWSATEGAKLWRQSYRIALKGINSDAALKGLWSLKDRRTAHTHVIVEHDAPHTRSLQCFKGVLEEISRSSFEGKIIVRSEAQKTEAYQVNHNLLLSSGAVANSKPNLEIFADDVKASHGATVSQLDPSQLFYLKTRGINAADAHALLRQGFCREILEEIPYPHLLSELKGAHAK